MTKIAMCDACGDIIDHDKTFNRVISGRAKGVLEVKDRVYNINMTVVNSATGDYVDLDLCEKCFSKGVGGFGGL